jgi:hypothetical protein
MWVETPLVDKKLHQRLPIRATPFIRSNPTAERTDGNVCVVSSQDNVENLKIQFRSTARIKDTMKSIKQTIVKVVNYNKRKWIETLKPKGMESDYNGCGDIIGNERTVSGLLMASKVSITISDAELGKPHSLPECPGSDLVRENDGEGGRGKSRKQTILCNAVYRGTMPCSERRLTYSRCFIV